MLLVLDVGNTNTVLGVFDGAAKRDTARQWRLWHESAHYERLVANWRVATIATQTVDEYGVLFRNLFAMANLEAKAIRGIMISSVVPPLDSTLREVCETLLQHQAAFCRARREDRNAGALRKSGGGGRRSHCEFGGCFHEVWRPLRGGGFRHRDDFRLCFR